MWIKQYLDGSVVTEDKDQGITWLKTPLDNLYSVELWVTTPQGGKLARRLHAPRYSQFWHSRTIVANESYKPIIVAERIQGLMEDGKWFTVTWNGHDFIETFENRPIGKPVIK